jgi:hypothetical protein
MIKVGAAHSNLFRFLSTPSSTGLCTSIFNIPWHTLCIDLIGPYKIGKGKNEATLHALTMIDPATGWLEIADLDIKQADEIINRLEFTWLT